MPLHGATATRLTSSTLLCKSDESSDELMAAASDGADDTPEDVMSSTSRARSRESAFCALGVELLLLLPQTSRVTMQHGHTKPATALAAFSATSSDLPANRAGD
jgi:hypothetical protein